MLFLDGVYFDDAKASGIRFRWVKAPTNAELTELTNTIAHRVGRFLERRELLERDAENSYLAGDVVDARKGSANGCYVSSARLVRAHRE
jgi:hypothetical protein